MKPTFSHLNVGRVPKGNWYSGIPTIQFFSGAKMLVSERVHTYMIYDMHIYNGKGHERLRFESCRGQVPGLISSKEV